jgi:uncharacterized cupin superfamily protein
MPTDVPLRVEDVAPERREFGEIAGTRRRLAAAAGAKRLGIALIEIDPGKRFAPPHSHADQDEVFLVLAGSGLSYLTSSPDDARTYAVGVDDVLWHPSNGEAHTLIAGEHGLTVLVVAEGSRTNITFLPRTGQFWLGPRWTPADTEHPFVADAELGSLEPLQRRVHGRELRAPSEKSSVGGHRVQSNRVYPASRADHPRRNRPRSAAAPSSPRSTPDGRWCISALDRVAPDAVPGKGIRGPRPTSTRTRPSATMTLRGSPRPRMPTVRR